MCVIDRGTPENVGKQSGQSVDADGAPKLASLPPTNEAFNENIARAHLQVAVWRNALQRDPLVIDPTAFGWSLEE